MYGRPTRDSWRSGIVGRCHLGHLRPAQRWRTHPKKWWFPKVLMWSLIFVTFYRIFSLGDLRLSCMFFQDFKGVQTSFRGVYMIIWFCGGIIHLVSSIKTGDKHGDPAWWCKMDTRWYWRAVCQLESITIFNRDPSSKQMGHGFQSYVNLLVIVACS